MRDVSHPTKKLKHKGREFEYEGHNINASHLSKREDIVALINALIACVRNGKGKFVNPFAKAPVPVKECLSLVDYLNIFYRISEIGV